MKEGITMMPSFLLLCVECFFVSKYVMQHVSGKDRGEKFYKRNVCLKFATLF